MPGNSSVSRSFGINASTAAAQQATSARQGSALSHAHPDSKPVVTGGLFGAARTVLGATLNFFARQLNQTPTVPDKPSTSPADAPERFTPSIQDDAQSGVHSDAPLPQLQASQTSDAVTIPDSRDTPGYWRNFSHGCRKDCNDKLLSSSARDMTIDRKQLARPIAELTFVNSSGIQCVRNPGHELRLHIAAAVSSMSSTNQSAASSSTTRSSAGMTAASSSPSVTSSITLHGHSNVFAHVRPDASSPVKQAQRSELALAQSPDDTSNDPAPRTLQRSLSASDAHPGNNPLANRNAGNDWLLYALQSNRSNMLQFVSRNSHVAGSNGKEVPLLTQLTSQLAKASATGTAVKLDEHHTLVSIDHDPDADQWKGGQHVVGLKTATLTVKTQQNGKEALKRITLTQVAPPFENRLLKADHLKIVHDICKGAALDLNQTVVFSYAGMGRNATLAVYDQLVHAIENGSITNAAELEEGLSELVKSGRSVHHQNFVQSDEQLAQLFSAAYRRLIEKHPGAAVQTDNTNSPAGCGSNTPEDSPASNASSRRSSVDDAGSYISGGLRSGSHGSLFDSGSLPENFMSTASSPARTSSDQDDIIFTRTDPAYDIDGENLRDWLNRIREASDPALETHASLEAPLEPSPEATLDAHLEAKDSVEGLPLTPVQSEEDTQNAANDQPLFFNDAIASRDSTPRVSENGVAMNSEPARASSTLHPQRA